MFLFILDSDDQEIMAIPVVHESKIVKKQGYYHNINNKKKKNYSNAYNKYFFLF